MKPRLLFLIRSLDSGGAQRQLLELARALRDDFSVAICTLYDGGSLAREVLEQPGIRLYSLHKTGRWDLHALVRLRRVLKEFRPRLLHGYMGVANELALVGARLTGARTVWGIRSSYMDLARYGLFPRLAFQVGRFAAPYADRIIVNSNAGMAYYEAQGYPVDRMVVVPNGIDVDRFRPSPMSGARLREEWGIRADERLIGLVARIDPIKDQETFLRAAATLAAQLPKVRFMCIGGGSAERQAELRALSAELGIEERVIWSGHQADMAAAYSALDLCTLTSYGEGFPNALAEAMACGTPCVATDAGDSRWILGPLGLVVPARAPTQLAAAWKTMLEQTSRAEPEQASARRARIVENFSVELLRRRTAAVLLEVC